MQGEAALQRELTQYKTACQKNKQVNQSLQVMKQF